MWGWILVGGAFLGLFITFHKLMNKWTSYRIRKDVDIRIKKW